MPSFNTTSWHDLFEAVRRANDKVHSTGKYLDLITPAQFKKAQLTLLAELDAQFLKNAHYDKDAETEQADVSDIALEVIDKVAKEKTLHENVSIEEYHAFRARLMRELHEMWER